MNYDVDSIQWNYKNVIARIRIVFPNKNLPLKLCENQYLPSYRHSLKCAGSNNDMTCSVFNRDDIKGVRKCEYDATTSSPFPDERNYCCLGQSSYTCCIRRCGFDNTKCNDNDPTLNHVLFHKMDSEHQRFTGSIGGVKSGCYTAMGNLDISFFDDFGHARPRCINDSCRLQCLPPNLLCPSKSCTTPRCFNNSPDCSYDGNWEMTITTDTIDPRHISGYVNCEFFYMFPTSYNVTTIPSLLLWIQDLTSLVIPNLSYVLSTIAILYQTHLLFHDNIYHFTEESLNPFIGQPVISKSNIQSFDNYKANLVTPFQHFFTTISTNLSIETITNFISLPYVSSVNNFFYVPVSSSQLERLNSLNDMTKMSLELENMVSQFLQDDRTTISPPSTIYQNRSKFRWDDTNGQHMIVHIMEWSFNNRITVTQKYVPYTEFIKNTSNKFVLSYHIPLYIDTFSPMLVAFLESRNMLSSFSINKILRDTSLMPISFFKNLGKDFFEETTINHCNQDISNIIMDKPSEIFLLRSSNECQCINSSLVPTPVKFENDFYNKTSMCFQLTCQDPFLRQSYDLSDENCREKCGEFSSWLPTLQTKDFDKTRYENLCILPPEPSPSPSPSEDGVWRRKRWVILTSILLGVVMIVMIVMTILIFYFGDNKSFDKF